MKRLPKQIMTPKQTSIENPIHSFRENTLKIVLLLTAIMFAGFFGIQLITLFFSESLGAGIILSSAYIILVVMALTPKIPYRIREVLGLVFIYGMVLTSSLQSGPSVETIVLLIFSSIFSTLYFEHNIGLMTTIFNTIALLLFGFGLEVEWFYSPLIPKTQEPWNFVSWVKPILLYFLVGTVTVFTIKTLFNIFKRTLQNNELSTHAIINECDQYKKQIRDLEYFNTFMKLVTQTSRNIYANLESDNLFPQITERIREHFNFYYVGVFLPDQDRKFAVLQAGTGDAGKAMLEAGHKLPISETSVIGWAFSKKEYRLVRNADQDSIRFDNPNLPKTRSELAIPMIRDNQVLGVISFQSDKVDAFNENDILILQDMTDNLAIAFENWKIFNQMKSKLEDIQGSYEGYLKGEWSELVNNQGEISCFYENESFDSILEESLKTIEKPLVIRDQIIGYISLETDNRTWEPEDEAFLEAVTAQTALALESIHLMEATRYTARQNQILAELSNKVWESTDIDTILKTTLYELVEALNASNGFVHLAIPETIETFMPNRSVNR